MNDSTLQANPYKGPRPFERDDTLYGRDDDIVEVVNLLIADRIVLLYSPSGAGKTSLVNAGVTPAMEKRGFQVLPTIRVHHPAESSDPAVEGNRYVFSALRSLEQGVGAIPPTVLASIGFQAYLTQRSWISDDPRPKLLIFDQFEEILTKDPTDQEQ